MSDSVQEPLMLYKNGIIDGEALNNALKAFNNAPEGPQPQDKFCESSCLFYLSFNFDFYVSKIMHL